MVSGDARIKWDHFSVLDQTLVSCVTLNKSLLFYSSVSLNVNGGDKQDCYSLGAVLKGYTPGAWCVLMKVSCCCYYYLRTCG